jgi:hypothetical protein
VRPSVMAPPGPPLRVAHTTDDGKTSAWFTSSSVDVCRRETGTEIATRLSWRLTSVARGVLRTKTDHKHNGDQMPVKVMTRPPQRSNCCRRRAVRRNGPITSTASVSSMPPVVGERSMNDGAPSLVSGPSSKDG